MTYKIRNNALSLFNIFFRQLLVIIILISINVNYIQAQIGAELNKTGTSSAQFLKIGIGSRAIGMGGAFTALADDINSIYWNPAGLSRIFANEAYFNHVDWIADVKLDYAGLAIDFSNFGTIGIFVSLLSMAEMPVRTLEKPEGTGERFSAGAFLIGFSFARNLTDNFSIGFNLKYLNEFIWNENAVGFALDVGTLYTIPFLNQFRLAASISNFGPKMKMQGRDALIITTQGPGGGNIINANLELEEFELPLLFRFGIAIDALKLKENRLTISFDAVHPNDNTEHLNTGFEYTWNETFFIRSGYKALFERGGEQGLTVGLGLNYRLVETILLKIDYAYEDFGRLSNVQYFSVGVKF